MPAKLQVPLDHRKKDYLRVITQMVRQGIMSKEYAREAIARVTALED